MEMLTTVYFVDFVMSSRVGGYVLIKVRNNATHTLWNFLEVSKSMYTTNSPTYLY